METLASAKARLATWASIWVSRGFMDRARFSGLVGQTSTQEPQPRQSSAYTCMRNFMPVSSLPLAGTVTKLSGAPASSSSLATTGRMAAWGHTKEHWQHWMQLSATHSGTLMATPRFSQAAVPRGMMPAGSMADTGSLSPRWARMGRTTPAMYSSSPQWQTSAPSVASAQDSGYLISTRASMPLSTAAMFMLTILSPFMP